MTSARGEAQAPNTGSFHALGWEAGGPYKLFLLSLVGIIQFFAVVLLSQFGHSYKSIYDDTIFPSLIIMGVSLVIFGAISAYSSRPHLIREYDVTFEDRRSEGGTLRLSYTDSKGLRRESAVKSVKAEHGPLFRPMFTAGGTMSVGETKAAMVLTFSDRHERLELGFPSLEEMEKVYEQIKTK